MQDVRLYAKPNVDILLVGNKVDLQSKREVDYKAAKEYAEKNNMGYVEVCYCLYCLLLD